MYDMLARFEDEDHNALVSGDAIDRNGFRKADGSFYPTQPSFLELTEQQRMALNSVQECNSLVTQECTPALDDFSSRGNDEIKKVAIAVAGALGTLFITEVIIPPTKQFFFDKVLPSAENAWDSMLEKLDELKENRKAKKIQKQLEKQQILEISAQDATTKQDSSELSEVVEFEEYRKRA